ncbi:hypothetical protein N7478_010679 [Penicillium angulare]|uniref:uncharacterized protein n=1 Tax=Penicillium angulare TaxID=116970 RepID=UPI0025421DAA|nr:uncharacterized protein N7478_010679 [Penicillium angulare]KAJ5267871.1 hypothetical protein N7478_010679 [Penicillium angulare]
MADQVSYENRSGRVSADPVDHHELNNPTDPLESAASTLTSNTQPGRQGVKVRRLEIGTDVDDIYCIFCLAENGNPTDENVILQCRRGQALSHLGCMEEWLKQCRPKMHKSCCACRSEEPQDALLRGWPSQIRMSINAARSWSVTEVAPCDIPSADSYPSVYRFTPVHILQAGAVQQERPQALPRRSARLVREGCPSTPLRRSPRFRIFENQMGGFEWEGI